MRKAQQRWDMVAKVLMKTGATVWAQSMVYKVGVQTVLIYGSDTWVVTDEMLEFLEEFHPRVDHQIAGMSAQQVG